MHDFIKDDSLSDGEKKALLIECDALLGIGLSEDPEKGLIALGHIALDSLPEKIQSMIHQRETARIAKNWPEADHLRDAITLAGYTVEDSPEGPKITKINKQ